MSAREMTRSVRKALDSLPEWVLPVAGFALLAVFPLLQVVDVVEMVWIRVGVTSLIFVLLALGLNLVMGEAGQLNLGYIAFFAFGSYATALLSSPKFGLHWPFWALLVVSAAVAMIAGFAIGLPTLRLRGDYLAIVTLAFGEIVRLSVTNLQDFTNGPNGITGIHSPTLLGASTIESLQNSALPAALVDALRIDTPVKYYYLVLAFVIVTTILIRNIKDSRVGRAWNALREDELAAVSTGVMASRAKLLSVVLSAGIAGVAGSLYASYANVISPESFLFMQSVIVVCMVVLGGMGSVRGVIVGAIVLTALPQVIRESAGTMRSEFEVYRMLIFGIIIVVMVMFRPEGLMPNQLWRREARESDPRELEKTRQSLFDLEEGKQDLEA